MCGDLAHIAYKSVIDFLSESRDALGHSFTLTRFACPLDNNGVDVNGDGWVVAKNRPATPGGLRATGIVERSPMTTLEEKRIFSALAGVVGKMASRTCP